MQHFYEMCEGPIHYLQLFLRETVLHMVSWIFLYLYVYLCWFETTIQSAGYTEYILLHLCMCERVWVEYE